MFTGMHYASEGRTSTGGPRSKLRFSRRWLSLGRLVPSLALKGTQLFLARPKGTCSRHPSQTQGKSAVYQLRTVVLRQSPCAALRANLRFTSYALSCSVCSLLPGFCHLFSNIASACLRMLFFSFAGPRTLACEPQLSIQRSISNRSASSIRNSIRP